MRLRGFVLLSVRLCVFLCVLLFFVHVCVSLTLCLCLCISVCGHIRGRICVLEFRIHRPLPSPPTTNAPTGSSSGKRRKEHSLAYTARFVEIERSSKGHVTGE